MHNPEYFLENETHKIFWNFEIQTDYLISAKRLDIGKNKKAELAELWILRFRLTTE